MVKTFSDHKRKSGKKPEFVIARFSLSGHPRFKGYSFSSKYLGWSKPNIHIMEIDSLQIDQQIRFNGSKVQVVDWSEDSITLQFECEKRVLHLNDPICTSFCSRMDDRSSEFYLGCWSSWGKFLQYYLGVKWARWIDDRRHQMIMLPRDTTIAIKRRLRWRWGWQWDLLKRKIDEICFIDLTIRQEDGLRAANFVTGTMTEKKITLKNTRKSSRSNSN